MRQFDQNKVIKDKLLKQVYKAFLVPILSIILQQIYLVCQFIKSIFIWKRNFSKI